jgi:hypothetical protein
MKSRVSAHCGENFRRSVITCCLDSGHPRRTLYLDHSLIGRERKTNLMIGLEGAEKDMKLQNTGMSCVMQ